MDTLEQAIELLKEAKNDLECVAFGKNQDLIDRINDFIELYF